MNASRIMRFVSGQKKRLFETGLFEHPQHVFCEE